MATMPAGTEYTLGEMDQFILFGDSITQQAFSQNVSFSFAGALADVYQRRLDIINRGLSGYNTSQAIRALPLCMPEPESTHVKFLLIFFGANDARIQGSPGGPDQSVPLEEFKMNLRLMAQNPSVTAHQDIRIILVTTPPIDERKVLKYDREKYPALGRVLRRTAANTATYAEAVRNLGAELNVSVLDIHRAMLANSGYPTTDPDRTGPDNPPALLPGSMEAPGNPTLQSYLEDGLHFSGEGYRLLYGELMALIESTWPDQMPSKLPMRLPAWDYEPAWRLDGNGNPPPWRFGDGDGEMIVSGSFEARVTGVERAR